MKGSTEELQKTENVQFKGDNLALIIEQMELTQAWFRASADRLCRNVGKYQSIYAAQHSQKSDELKST